MLTDQRYISIFSETMQKYISYGSINNNYPMLFNEIDINNTEYDNIFIL